MITPDQEQKTVDWYERYYEKFGENRNKLILNPEVDWQHLSSRFALIRAIRSSRIEVSRAKLLDVGCGVGASLLPFLEFGAKNENLYGIEIQRERVVSANTDLPFLKITHGDARAMPYESQFFDVVFASTMFVQITDTELERDISAEMLRVTKIGGVVIINDWMLGNPRNPNYRAMSKKRIKSLFCDAGRCQYESMQRGALIPPIGRFLSRYAPSMYLFVHLLLRPLAALNVSVLRRLR